jgi:hypothetical protein
MVGKPTDANGTQASLDWSQIDWQKVEKTVLRQPQRIFMARRLAADGFHVIVILSPPRSGCF